MLTTLRGFFTPRHKYANPIDQERATLILYFSVVYLLITVWLTLSFALPVWFRTGIVTTGQLNLMGGFVFAPLLYSLVQTQRLRFASLLIIAVLIYICVAVVGSRFDSIRATFMFLPLAVAAYLFDWRGLLAVFGME